MSAFHWYSAGIVQDAFIVGALVVGFVVYTHWPRRPRRWRDSREVD